jgi:hypothetical protein
VVGSCEYSDEPSGSDATELVNEEIRIMKMQCFRLTDFR